MKKNVLLFGANSYIGSTFYQKYKELYHIQRVTREKEPNSLYLDFNKLDDIGHFIGQINGRYDAVIFAQGINPSKGIHEITGQDFIDMYKINLIAPSLIIARLAEALNENCSIVFLSSIAGKKGSYDPSYGSAKAGIFGLISSLSNAFPKFRFNEASLGLVEGSPVFNKMTNDFKQKHALRMYNNDYIQANNVASVIMMLIDNSNINRSSIPVDGGYL